MHTQTHTDTHTQTDRHTDTDTHAHTVTHTHTHYIHSMALQCTRWKQILRLVQDNIVLNGFKPFGMCWFQSLDIYSNICIALKTSHSKVIVLYEYFTQVVYTNAHDQKMY